jgi:hypothetical protein
MAWGAIAVLAAVYHDKVLMPAAALCGHRGGFIHRRWLEFCYFCVPGPAFCAIFGTLPYVLISIQTMTAWWGSLHCANHKNIHYYGGMAF